MLHSATNYFAFLLFVDTSTTHDIIFAIDTSQGVSAGLLQQLQDMIENMMSTMQITANNTRIGILSFSGKPVVELELTAGDVYQNVLNALGSLKRLPGKADLSKLAEKVKISFFSSQRDNFDQYLVVFVNSEIEPDVANASRKSFKELKEQGVQVVLVDVGMNMDETTLDEIMGSPEQMTAVRTDDLYSSLPTIFDGLKTSSKKGICIYALV